MKINLRRAAKIASDIQSEIAKINTDSEKRIVSNQIADPVTVKNVEVSNFEKNVNRAINLTRILYDIRQEISVTNSVRFGSESVSVNETLSEINGIKALLQVINKLVSVNNITPEDNEWSSIYAANVEKKKSPSYVDYGTEHLSLSLLAPTFKQNLKQKMFSLKRSLNRKSDLLLFLNTSLEIEIAEIDWFILEGEGIV